ncbi:hypothetical protein EYC80_004684 [Monilinia laxa]|uniref:Uncharacterized protein n=1 Tax=Monilinia laxa TaxID=61186 RepID=A0A5N6KHR6_MONLA|nr:hypothetical protein EYC80_004684 [Monilinia laxa]
MTQHTHTGYCSMRSMPSNFQEPYYNQREDTTPFHPIQTPRRLKLALAGTDPKLHPTYEISIHLISFHFIHCMRGLNTFPISPIF